MAGVKHDQSKAPLDLLPYDSLEEIAKVLAFGRDKYGAYNWKEGISYSRLIAAAMRHLGQFNNGVDMDEEAQTLHTANAACNLLFLIWMQKNRPDMDDRWKPKTEKKESTIFNQIDEAAGIIINNGGIPTVAELDNDSYTKLCEENGLKGGITSVITNSCPYGLYVYVRDFKNKTIIVR
jgi:hypothetical protein